MFQKILIASGATFLAASAAAASSPAVPQKVQKPAAEQKYCLQYQAMTGTRINRTECKTKSEWAREGVNVDRLIRS